MSSPRIEIIGPATLYHGDCREILPTIGRLDAIVTDPPYGIGACASGKHGTDRLAKNRDYGTQTWDDEPLDPQTIALFRASSDWQIIFGGNFYALPPSPCWLVWDKLNGENRYADCELAWTNLKGAVRQLRFMWHGMLRDGKEQRGDHPTQKPVTVMKWCIDKLPKSSAVICDPCMGSGTTIVAAVDMGLRGIGIEREEKYFSTACRRVEQAIRQEDFLRGAAETAKAPSQQLDIVGEAE